jgi:hypothetical protein
MSSVFGGGSDIPKVTTKKAVVSATPADQMSETDKRNKQLAMSVLTQNWMKDAPKLGKSGLLGM